MSSRGGGWGWEASLAGAAAGLLIGAIRCLPDPGPIRLPAGGAVVAAPPPRLGAAVATIARWEEFWVDESNPFVPWQLRGGPAPPAPAPPGGPGPVDRSPPSAPARTLPSLASGGGGLPELRGFQRGGDDPGTIRMHLPGDAADHLLRPGQWVAGWTLLAIEVGNLARIAGPDGRIHTLVIGR